MYKTIKKNIIRTILVYLIGIILSFILHLSFYKYESRADIIIFVEVFYFFSIMGIYSLVIDNLLYWIYRKNNMNAFLVSNSICFIYIVFSAINNDLKEYNPIYYFCAPIFFVLNILLFFILKQNKTQ